MARPLLLTFAALALASPVHASPPAVVPYVGSLTWDDGTPFDGEVDIVAGLYASRDGTDASDLVWGPVSLYDVPVALGAFTLELGSEASPIPAEAFEGGELWLGLTLDGVAMEPRQAVVAVPWSLWAAEAERLGGLGPDAFVQTSDLANLGFLTVQDLAAVATTGAYADLAGAPDLTGYALTADLAEYAKSSALGEYAKSATLAEYAKSSALGEYAKTATLADYAKTTALAAVATSGRYADLAGVPDLGVYLRSDGSVPLGGPWDLGRQPLAHAVVGAPATPPAGAVRGELWFDPAAGRLAVHDGAGWRELAVDDGADPLAPLTDGGYTKALTVADVKARGPAIDVRAFGAVGDGATDDAPAIQAAFDFAKGLGHAATILFPPARYKVGRTLVLDCACHVEGYGATLVTSTFAYLPNERPVLRGYRSHSSVRGLGFELQAATGVTPTAAIRWEDSLEEPDAPYLLEDLLFADLRVSLAVAGRGLFVAQIGRNVTIRDSLFEQLQPATPSLTGIAVATNVGITHTLSDEGEAIAVVGNTMIGWGTSGFRFESKGDAQRSRLVNNVVKGCGLVQILEGLENNTPTYGINAYHFHGIIAHNHIEGGSMGAWIDADGQDLTVVGNTFYRNSILGAIFEEFTGTFVGNYVRKNGHGASLTAGRATPKEVGPPGLGAGLVIGSTANATYSGNMVSDNAGVGIYLDRKTVVNQYYPLNLVFDGNIITNNGADGMWIDDPTARHIVLSDNLVADNGLAAASVETSTAAGVRVTSASGGVGSRLTFQGNTFANQVGPQAGGGGTDGRQRYGIAALDLAGNAYQAGAELVVRGNTFDGLPVALAWANGSKTLVGNLFLGATTVDVAGGTLIRDGNLGAVEGAARDQADGPWQPTVSGRRVDFSGTTPTVLETLYAPSAFGTTRPAVYEVTVSPGASVYTESRVYTGRLTVLSGSGRNFNTSGHGLVADVSDLYGSLGTATNVDLTPIRRASTGAATADVALTLGNVSGGVVFTLTKDNQLAVAHTADTNGTARTGVLYLRRIQ